MLRRVFAPSSKLSFTRKSAIRADNKPLHPGCTIITILHHCSRTVSNKFNHSIIYYPAFILKPIWFSVLPSERLTGGRLETKSWLQLSPDKKPAYSLNFISDFIRKPLRDEYISKKSWVNVHPRKSCILLTTHEP